MTYCETPTLSGHTAFIELSPPPPPLGNNQKRRLSGHGDIEFDSFPSFLPCRLSLFSDNGSSYRISTRLQERKSPSHHLVTPIKASFMNKRLKPRFELRDATRSQKALDLKKIFVEMKPDSTDRKAGRSISTDKKCSGVRRSIQRDETRFNSSAKDRIICAKALRSKERMMRLSTAIVPYCTWHVSKSAKKKACMLETESIIMYLIRLYYLLHCTIFHIMCSISKCVCDIISIVIHHWDSRVILTSQRNAERGPPESLAQIGYEWTHQKLLAGHFSRGWMENRVEINTPSNQSNDIWLWTLHIHVMF